MHYDLSYLKEPIYSDINKQAGNHVLQGTLSVTTYENGCILPCLKRNQIEYDYSGGVTDAEHLFVESSALHEMPCKVGGPYPASCKKSDQSVIYIGFLLPEWGNVITDSLKKLWFLHTPEAKSMILKGAQIAYVTFENRPVPQYQLELWELGGYDCGKWLHVTTPTQFKSVTVPDNSLIALPDDTRFFHSFFADEINRIKANVDKHVREAGLPLPTPHDIYLTRTRLKHNKDYNEIQIERLFEQRGYQVIAPEKLSVTAQIWLMMNCNNMVATEGSISHNAIFMSPKSKLVILQKADYMNGYQHVINAMADLDVTYIPAHHSTRASKDMPWAGPFYLYVTPELSRWCGICPPHSISPSLKPSYWKYRLKNIGFLLRIKLWLYLIVRKCIKYRRNNGAVEI